MALEKAKAAGAEDTTKTDYLDVVEKGKGVGSLSNEDKYNLRLDIERYNIHLDKMWSTVEKNNQKETIRTADQFDAKSSYVKFEKHSNKVLPRNIEEEDNQKKKTKQDKTVDTSKGGGMRMIPKSRSPGCFLCFCPTRSS